MWSNGIAELILVYIGHLVAFLIDWSIVVGAGDVGAEQGEWGRSRGRGRLH